MYIILGMNLGEWAPLLGQALSQSFIKKVIKKILQTTDQSHS